MMEGTKNYYYLESYCQVEFSLDASAPSVQQSLSMQSNVTILTFSGNVTM